MSIELEKNGGDTDETRTVPKSASLTVARKY